MNFLNSLSQFCKTLIGHTTRNADSECQEMKASIGEGGRCQRAKGVSVKDKDSRPQTPLLLKCAKNEMVCNVFPSPISSARIPFRPFS